MPAFPRLTLQDQLPEGKILLTTAFMKILLSVRISIKVLFAVLFIAMAASIWECQQVSKVLLY